MLKAVKIDWAWLQDNLNLIIDAVNRQKPLSSATIAIDEMPSGTMLSLTAAQGGGGAPSTDTPWKTTPDGEQAGWHSLNVVDQNCNQYTMWVWGGTPVLKV
jgi:hypothetical protein